MTNNKELLKATAYGREFVMMQTPQLIRIYIDNKPYRFSFDSFDAACAEFTKIMIGFKI